MTFQPLCLLQVRSFRLTLIEEIRRVFMDENEFENRDKSLILALFGIFGV